VTDLLLTLDPQTGEIDFVYNEDTGLFTMTESLTDTVRNNLILSIKIPRGALVTAPDFGSRRSEIDVVDEEAIDRLVQYDRQATQWIVDAGRAKSIEIEAEEDTGTAGRINERITAVLPDDTVVDFTTFFKVV